MNTQHSPQPPQFHPATTPAVIHGGFWARYCACLIDGAMIGLSVKLIEYMTTHFVPGR